MLFFPSLGRQTIAMMKSDHAMGTTGILEAAPANDAVVVVASAASHCPPPFRKIPPITSGTGVSPVRLDAPFFGAVERDIYVASVSPCQKTVKRHKCRAPVHGYNARIFRVILIPSSFVKHGQASSNLKKFFMEKKKYSLRATNRYLINLSTANSNLHVALAAPTRRAEVGRRRKQNGGGCIVNRKLRGS